MPEGASGDTACNGTEGLRLAHENSYQVVITDSIMPEKDGLEVLMNLRKSFLGMGIIVITGGSVKLDILDLEQTAKVLGADRVMLKGLDYDLLRSTVHELVAAYG